MTDAEIYLAHLDNITEGREPVIRQVPSGDPSLADIAVFTYENWPRPGFITGFTFGLSLATHPDWKHGRAELMISMESLDPAWTFSIGYLASRLRGDCPFSYGNTINFREQISDESGMDAFLILALPHLDRDQKLVKMNSFDCFIAGVYPLYSTELALYEKVGIEAFWHLSDWDPMNVKRARLA